MLLRLHDLRAALSRGTTNPDAILPSMNARLRQSWPALLIASLAFLYCGIEWAAAHSIGGNTIDSAARFHDRADFHLLVRNLAETLTSQCAAAQPRLVLFDDSEVALPYLLSGRSSNQLGSCTLIRATRVTPFDAHTLNSCAVLLVEEIHPPHSEQYADMSHLTEAYGANWAVAGQWRSSRKNFGYLLLAHTGCA